MVKKKSETKRRRWLIVGLVLLVVIAGAGFYAFKYTGLFRVKNIDINIAGGYSGIQLTVADILGNRPYPNIFTPFPAIDLAQFPYIASYTVSENYLQRTVGVEAVARQRAFIWCMTASQDCYWVDDTGFAFDTAPQSSGGDLGIVVRDSSSRDIGIGDYVLPSDQFKNFVADINVLNQLNIPITEIEISNINYEEMTVVTAGGPQIYFGFTFDPVVSGDDLVLKQLLQSADWSKYCYVDLRTMYKAYTSLTCM